MFNPSYRLVRYRLEGGATLWRICHVKTARLDTAIQIIENKTKQENSFTNVLLQFRVACDSALRVVGYNMQCNMQESKSLAAWGCGTRPGLCLKRKYIKKRQRKPFQLAFWFFHNWYSICGSQSRDSERKPYIFLLYKIMEPNWPTFTVYSNSNGCLDYYFLEPLVGLL